MKLLKTQLTTLFLLPLTFSCFGQNQIVYDFQKGVLVNNDFVENGKIKPISTGDFVIFKIININTFRFKGEIEGKSINYLTEMPSELQTIFRQPKSLDQKNTTEGLEEIQEAVEKMKTELTDATEKSTDNQGFATQANNIFEKTNNELTILKTSLQEAKEDLDSKKINLEKATKALVDAKKRKESKKLVSDAIQKENDINKNLSNIKKSIDSLTTVIEKKEKNVLIEAKEKTKAEKVAEVSDAFKIAMEKLVKACNDYIKIAEKVANIKVTRVELINLSKQDWRSLKEMQDNLPPVDTEVMKADFKEFVKFYAQAISLYRSAKIAATAAGSYNEEKKLIAEASEQLEEGHHKITEDDFLKLIEDIMVLDKAMQNPKSFEVTSPLIQIDGDFVSFDVKTPPAQVNDLLPHTPNKTFRVEIPAKGGWKVDFGVGPAFSFNNGSKDNKFSLSTTPGDTTTNTLTSIDNQNVISPGIVAMMHVYPRLGKNYAIGGMFGVGASFQSVNDVNASYYLGISTIVGKAQKVMVSVGVSFLRVDRLKSNYRVDNTYNKNLAIGDVTEKSFQSSPFFSISYNITNRVEVK